MQNVVLTKSVTASASPGTRNIPSDNCPLVSLTALVKKGTIIGILRSGLVFACKSIINCSDSPNTDGLKGASFYRKGNIKVSIGEKWRRGKESRITFARAISALVNTFPLAPRLHILFSLLDTC